MQQLENIITKLKSDPYYAVTITDGSRFRTIATNITGEQMAAQKGSVEDYFNSLYKTGIASIGIDVKRKNGSTFKTMNESISITFQQETNVHHAQPVTPTHTPELVPGLNAPGLLGGLNQVDLIYRHMDYNRVIADNARLTSENKRLQDDVDRMRLEALQFQFSEAKANGNKEMLSGLIPVLMQALPALLGKAPAGGMDASGLGTPQAIPGLSEGKAMLIDQVMQHSDAISDNLLVILNGMATHPEFATELIDLLQKYELT